MENDKTEYILHAVGVENSLPILLYSIYCTSSIHYAQTGVHRRDTYKQTMNHVMSSKGGHHGTTIGQP